MAEVVPVLATEYVFSAPPEVDNNVAEEIPTQEADYPLYECEAVSDQETIGEIDESDSAKIDSHNCECIDCEEVSQEEEKQTKLSSNNQSKK